MWRPADVPTNGVASISTRGSADTFNPDERKISGHGVTPFMRGAVADAREIAILAERLPAGEERDAILRRARAISEDRAVRELRGSAPRSESSVAGADVEMCACCGERPAAFCDLCAWCDAIMHGDAREIPCVSAYLVKHGGPATSGNMTDGTSSLDDDTLGMLVENPEIADDHPCPTTIGAVRALLLDGKDGR